MLEFVFIFALITIECSGTPRRLIKLSLGNNPFRGASREETKKKKCMRSPNIHEKKLFAYKRGNH
jgi:hypothetical protein